MSGPAVTPTPLGPWRVGTLFRNALVAAGLGLVGLIVGILVDRRQTAFSFLVAFAFGVSIALGALLLLLISHAMKATWSVVLRRLVETTAATLPVFAVLFVPIALFAPDLYAWVHPERIAEEHVRHLVHHKAAYLNVPFFLVRAAVYFAIWCLPAWLLRTWSLRQDESGDLLHTDRARRLGPGFIPPVALALTFASFDWLMSLEPAWSSTAYGVYFFAGGFLAALAFLAVLMRRASTGPLAGLLQPGHFHGVGRLVFAFTIFWAYIALFQGLIIWMANKPEEVVWYLRRLDGGWGALLVVLIFGHFALPFLILLSYWAKRSANVLGGVATWLLGMHYLDLTWLVMPVARPDGPQPAWLWLDLAALLFVGGAAAAFGARLLDGRLPAPVRDPGYATSLRYRA